MQTAKQTAAILDVEEITILIYRERERLTMIDHCRDLLEKARKDGRTIEAHEDGSHTIQGDRLFFSERSYHRLDTFVPAPGSIEYWTDKPLPEHTHAAGPNDHSRQHHNAIDGKHYDCTCCYFGHSHTIECHRQNIERWNAPQH